MGNKIKYYKAKHRNVDSISNFLLSVLVSGKAFPVCGTPKDHICPVHHSNGKEYISINVFELGLRIIGVPDVTESATWHDGEPVYY